MATEFKLSYTAEDINNRLGRIDSLATKSELPTKTSDLTNDSGFVNEAYVNNKIAEIGGSTGGGSGISVQSDMNQNDSNAPDYIKNRTHWAEDTVTVTETILEETTFTLTEDSYGFNYFFGQYNFVEGAECIVTWDGVEYTTVVEYDSNNDAYFIGNPMMDGHGDDNGQPFAAGCMASQSMLVVLTLDTTFPVTHTIKIVSTYDYEKIHKLDNKFINSEWMASKETIDVEILPETAISITDGHWQGQLSSVYKDLRQMRVLWNGIEYNSIVFPVDDASYYFGNLSELGVPTGIDMPFIGILLNTTIHIQGADGDYTVQISAIQDVYNKLPEQYMPDYLEADSLKVTAGASNTPVYINASGLPQAIKYQINKTVPSNAVFTDTTYTLSQDGSTVTLTGSNGKSSSITVSGGSNYTFDSIPTSGSTNPVTSDGIYTELQKKQNALTFDSIPTSGSTNPVTSDGIYTAINELSTLPKVNLSNNGAFLRVVSGAWKAVVLPNAEDGEF